MSEFMGFHTPDNSCGRGRILPLMRHFELMKWAAFRGLNGLLSAFLSFYWFQSTSVLFSRFRLGLYQSGA